MISRILNCMFILFHVIITFHILCGKINLTKGRFCHLGWAQILVFLYHLIKLILFLCWCNGFHIAIYLDDILVLIHSKIAGKRAPSFLYCLLVCLGLHTNLSKSEIHLTCCFCLLGLLWDTVYMSVSILTDRLLEVQQLTLCFRHSQIKVHQVVFFGKANFVPMDTHSFIIYIMWFK